MKKNKSKNKIKKIIAGLCVAVVALIGFSFWQVGEYLPPVGPRICLDAGHGGDDVGAVNGERYEKDDNLRLALAVGKILEENGVDVIYTRTQDVFVELEERATFANRRKATYFISIHRNSAEVEVSGVEAWIENTASVSEEKLAKNITDAIQEVGFGNDRGVKRGYQGNALSNYLVNSATQMPSCLLEMGFITTEQDNELFDENFDAYAKAIADGIMKGIESEGNG